MSHGHDARKNAPNEVTEMWKEIHQEEQQKGEARKASNLVILRASTLPFQYRNGGDIVLIRNKAYPAIDFWPTRNKWRVGDRNMLGDAQALIDFLKRRAMR